MKKIILFLVLSIIAPLSVLAVSEVDYDVKDVYIDSSIDFMGSMHIKEAIIIEGSLNGFERVINYKNSALKDWTSGEIDFANSSIYNARGVSLSLVSAFNISEDQIGWNIFDEDYKDFNETVSAVSGNSGVYTSRETEDGIDVKVYSPNESGYIVYLFDYYIDQAVVLHNDIAEIYWTFLPQDFDPVESVNIQLTIPGSCTDDKFRFWAHGSLNGNISGISDAKDDDGNILYKGVLATVNDVEFGKGVDIRMTFDKSLMSVASSFLNNSGIDALDKIIEVETERANDANSQRKMIKIVYYGIYGISIIYLIGIVLLWIYLYRKYDREHNVNFTAKYYREFTGDYSVEVIEYLMEKNISNKALSASIMNLIYKKNIEIEEISNSKDDLKLILKNRDNVSKAENIILDLLFSVVGKNSIVTLKQIENYSSNVSTSRSFVNKYNSWKNQVVMDAESENFFEDISTAKIIGFVYFILGMIIMFLNIYFNIGNTVLIILIVVMSIVLLIYTNTFKKWTKKGREHYLKWNAFKNFLKDFGSFSNKEVPEIKLWEKYLVYATVFGLAKEVQKAMNIKLSEMGDTTVYNSYRPLYYHNIYIGDRLDHSISHAYNKGTSLINAENAKSSFSSGSGFGGGFSSGGGFGGGGGSGHGF